MYDVLKFLAKHYEFTVFKNIWTFVVNNKTKISEESALHTKPDVTSITDKRNLPTLTDWNLSIKYTLH